MSGIGTEADYEAYLEEARSVVFHVKYGDKAELFRQHQLTLDKLDKSYERFGNLKKMLNQLEWDMTEVRNKLKHAVTSEVDNSNQPKYRNAEARSGELERRLRLHEEYQKNKGIHADTGDELLDVELDIKKLRGRLKFFEVNA